MVFKDLDGMFWNLGDFDFQIPHIGDPIKACAVYTRNMAEITWNCMRTLENNPTTLPQTRTILRGQSVAGLKIFDLMQVKNYADAAKELIGRIHMGVFKLDEENACAIHRYAGREDALEWGTFRTSEIGIHSIVYQPPEPSRLHDLCKNRFACLEKSVPDPRERSIALFLFMSRSQFFFDANRRTASLMMNGCLMSHGYWPITVLNQESDEFHELLGKFYESGNANAIMEFFSKHVQKLYPGQK